MHQVKQHSLGHRLQYSTSPPKKISPRVSYKAEGGAAGKAAAQPRVGAVHEVLDLGGRGPAQRQRLDEVERQRDRHKQLRLGGAGALRRGSIKTEEEAKQVGTVCPCHAHRSLSQTANFFSFINYGKSPSQSMTNLMDNANKNPPQCLVEASIKAFRSWIPTDC